MPDTTATPSAVMETLSFEEKREIKIALETRAIRLLDIRRDARRNGSHDLVQMATRQLGHLTAAGNKMGLSTGEIPEDV